MLYIRNCLTQLLSITIMEQVPVKFIPLSPCMRQKNQKVTLPDVPKVKGYTNLGWTTETGETEPEYSAGDTVKITKATRFYAVRRKSNYYTVSYYLGNGSTNAAYQKLTQTVEEGNGCYLCKSTGKNRLC